jgi:hypothetical protein
MGDQWPWKARELDSWEPFNETVFPKTQERCLHTKNFHYRIYSISFPKGQFSTLVGDLTCLGQMFYNDTTQEIQWWGDKTIQNPSPTHCQLF